MNTAVPDEPVIVLTSARCGSTLLRLLLDAHPDLACPPETNIVKVCAQLAGILGVLGESEHDDGARIKDVIAGTFGGYLARAGKRRWCDKSLGTATVASWFAGVYPEAKFICLYRHCMDTIHSGLEASPWGLMGYGFEQFAAPMGGNSVAALAAYWADHASRILQFERGNEGKCVRVHYERLVEDPESVASEIFAFLGVRQVPGITERCLAAGRRAAASQRVLGPGDHKVLATWKIKADSVGRGVRIPVDMIPPLQLKQVNHLLAELGYTQVDDAWRTSPCPPALLTADPAADGSAGSGLSAAGSSAEVPLCIGDEVMRSVLSGIGTFIDSSIGANLAHGLPTVGLRDPDRWRTFGLVAYHTDGQQLARGWRVDLESRSMAEVPAHGSARVDADWVVTAEVETWLGILSGRANMSSCLRSGTLRYIGLEDRDDRPGSGAGTRQACTAQAGTQAAAETERRLTILRELLGLAGSHEEADGPRPPGA